MIRCVCGDYDGEPADFYVTRMVRARKAHICVECREEVAPGEKYERTSGKWNGSMDIIRTCVLCLRIRDDLCPNGWVYGMLREAIWECLGTDYVTGEAKRAIAGEEE